MQQKILRSGFDFLYGLEVKQRSEVRLAAIIEPYGLLVNAYDLLSL
jgi:hypothetical protein